MENSGQIRPLALYSFAIMMISLLAITLVKGGIFNQGHDSLPMGARMRLDDLQQRNTKKNLALGHAKHLPGFRLTNGNRLNTAAVNFGKIAGVIDDKRHHRRQQTAIGAGTPGTGKAIRPGPR